MDHPLVRSSVRLVPAVCLGTILLLAGCRSAGPVPTTQMAQARTSVQQAEEAGARDYAGLDYRRAQQKLEEAEAALADRRHVRARRLAEEAAVDAELAAVRARSAKTQEAVEELRASIRALEQEMSRRDN